MNVKWKYDIEAGCKNKNDFWYSAMQFNGLFHLNFVSGEQEYLGRIPNEDIYKERLYGSMQFYNDKIYMIPFSASYITVYDTKKGQFTQYEIQPPKKICNRYNSNYKWQGSIICNKKIYMFGLTYAGIGIFDIDNSTMEYDYNWIETFINKYKFAAGELKEGFIFEKKIVCDNENIYVAMGISNDVMKYNIDSGEYCFINVGDSNDRFYNIKLVNDKMLLFYKNRKNGLIIFDIPNKKILKIVKFLGKNDISNAEAIQYKDHFLIVPLADNGIMEVTNDIKMLTYVEGFEDKSGMYYVSDDDKRIVFYTKSDGKITMCEDIKNFSEYELYYDNYIVDTIRKRCISTGDKYIRKETSDVTMRHFLDSLMQNEV